MKFRFDVIHKTQKPFYHLVLILVHTVTDLLKSNSCLLLNFSLEIIFRAHVFSLILYKLLFTFFPIIPDFRLSFLFSPFQFLCLPFFLVPGCVVQFPGIAPEAINCTLLGQTSILQYRSPQFAKLRKGPAQMVEDVLLFV